MRMFNNNQRQTGAPQTPKTSNAQSSAPNNNMKQNPQVNSSRNTTQNQNANNANKPLQRSSSPFGIRNNTNVTNNSDSNKAVPTNVQKKANNPIQNNNRSNNANQVNSRTNTRQQNQPLKKANEPSSTQQAVSQIMKNVVNTKQYTNAPATNYSHTVPSSVQNNKVGGNSNMHNTSASASELNKSSVFDNPVFKGIEPAKMAFIKDMISEMDGKKQDAKPQLLMSYVMRMRQEGFSFSPEELSAVTAALRPTMSDEENKQFDNFANLMKNMHR